MRIAITGTSGVGKTYLETVLQHEHGFIQIPKYTDRPKRSSETVGQGIYFVDRNELQRNNHNYFFKLNYMGYIYGWMVDDLRKFKKQNLTIAVTMDSMQGLLRKDLGFIPILLYTEVNNIDFLTARIKNQLNYGSLSDENKLKADDTIKRRIELAISETQNIQKYIKVVESVKGGKAFKISSDQTIYDDVIPYILRLPDLTY